jgi:polyhydroxyalkanoate synthesis regulator phasin
VKQIRSVRQQAHDLTGKLAASGKDVSELKKSSDSLWQKLTAIEDELMQSRNEADQDTENFPTKLDNQLAYVYTHLDFGDNRPTEGQKERVNDLNKEIDVQLAKLKAIIQTDVAAFNKLALAAGLSRVMVAK